MFNSRTLFIIGAGASKELGLPIGSELTKTIAEKLNISFEFGRQQTGDREIGEALRLHAESVGAHKIGPYLSASRQISSGMPLAISIDNYMDTHKDNECVQVCGKLAIVKSILEAERKSGLFVSKPGGGSAAERLAGAEGTWYVRFFKLLHESVGVTDVEKLFDQVAIICFNYDRCIEEFLEAAVQLYYGFDHARARDVVRHLNIIHPYGIVGFLPWQEGSLKIPFGGSEYNNNLLALSQGIKTFTERVEEEDTLVAIKREVARAEVIVFLGFAFHQANMELLRLEGDPVVRRIYGTAFQLSQPNCETIRRRLVRMFNERVTGTHEGPVYLDDLACAQLFDHYSYSITG